MIILTLNCGSSSVKYQLYDCGDRTVLARGAVERITVGGAFITHDARGKKRYLSERDCPSHAEALLLIIETLVDPRHGALSDVKQVDAVGHRVVHGGDKFTKSVLIDAETMESFRSFVDLAPLHLPANILGIEAAQLAIPGIPHCAIMDTAWHQTMPKRAFMYAVPYEWYERHSVRRFGFHGTSFLYCAKRVAVLLGADPSLTNAIICHIGNGASMCAVKNGVSVDTSMGMTPLEGLVMGTRSGDCDPSIPLYVMRKTGMSVDEVDSLMNKRSGILGITGEYVDRRDVNRAAEKGNEKAMLSIELEAYRLRKYIGAYAAVLGRVDALVFTAGVGEMASVIRAKATEGLSVFGFEVDQAKNLLSMTRNAETEISVEGSNIRTFVIPTDEELVMTEDTEALLQETYDIHTSMRYSFQSPDYRNVEREEKFAAEVLINPSLQGILADSSRNKSQADAESVALDTDPVDSASER